MTLSILDGILYGIILSFMLWIIFSAKRWVKNNGTYNLELLKLYKAPKEEYKLDHWNIEVRLNKTGQGLICPWCELGGEYGPRQDGVSNRRYRACKNCGIFQNINESKEQAILAKCECGVGAWTLSKEGKNCDKCGKYIKLNEDIKG